MTWYIWAMMEDFTAYQGVILWISGGSVLVFVLSLMAVPWMVARIPEDYFVTGKNLDSFGKNSMVRPVVWVIKNILGLVLFIMGLVMVFIPGQGLLTMLLGVVLMEFPGKHKLVCFFASKKTIQNGLNWIRKKKHVVPLRFPLH